MSPVFRASCPSKTRVHSTMSDSEMAERGVGEDDQREDSGSDNGEVQIKKRVKKRIVAKDSDDESDAEMKEDKADADAMVDEEEGGSSPKLTKKKKVIRSSTDPEVNEEVEGSPRADKRKKKLVSQRDSDSEDGDDEKENQDPAQESGNQVDDKVVDSKEARRREFEEMAMKRKREQEAAEAEAEEKRKSKKEKKKEGKEGKEGREGKEGKRSKKDKKRSRDEKRKIRDKKSKKEKSRKSKIPKRKSQEEVEEERIKALMIRHLSYVIGTAVMDNDGSMTKKSCREKLASIFGGEAVAEQKAYIADEIMRLITECQEIRQGEGLVAFIESHPPVEKHEVMTAKQLLLEQLDTILYRAIASGDATLSKKGCRERLAAVFGEECIEAHKEMINSTVVQRITEITAAGDVEERADEREDITGEQVEGRDDLVPKEEEEEEQSDVGVSSESGQEESEGAESKDAPAESDEDSDDSSAARRRKKKKGGVPSRKTGPLSGMVFVLAGKKLSDKDSSRVESLIKRIEGCGGKVQGTVTARVTHVIVAKSQGGITSSDSRVKSARKFGSKVVFDTFVDAAVSGGGIDAPAAADHMAEVTGGQGAKDVDDADEPGSAKKKSRKKAEREELEKLLNDAALSDEEGGGRRKRARAPAAKKSDADKEFSKAHQDRFGFLKDAKRRPFDPKDTVVPEATFYTDEDGTSYNSYMTLAGEGDSDGESADKFYAIKLLEAGGMMKGDKWHVVCQWGRVGAQKPGCDVADFFDINEAKQQYSKLFWDKTRNSWEGGSACFRAVSGKFTLVELSDGESDNEEDGSSWGFAGSAEGEFHSNLPAQVRGLLDLAVSRSELSGLATALGLSGPNVLCKVKRHHVQMGLAELCGAQQVLSKGDKRTPKDTDRMRSHQTRFAQIFPQDTAAGEDGEEARREGIYLGSVNAIKERGRLVEDTGEVCVSVAMRRRAANAPDISLHFADRFYRELKTRLYPLPTEGSNYALIERMLTNTGPAHDSKYTLHLDGVISVTRAGEGGRFAAFSRLPNKMLLWKGLRATSVPSVLAQGFRVPPAEAPSLMHMFGKGIYFTASAAEASKDCALTSANPTGVIAICEVALGERHDTTRPSFLRRAPHGTHSVHGRGRASHPPEGVAEVAGERGVSAVVMGPSASHGAAESSFGEDHYVVYDQGQVRLRYLVLVTAAFAQ